MNEVSCLIQTLLSKGYWIKTRKAPPTRNFDKVTKVAASAGSEPWWLAITDSKSSKNAIGVFYIDSSLNGWGCIDWDESKIISLHDLIIEAKNLEASASEESII